MSTAVSLTRGSGYPRRMRLSSLYELLQQSFEDHILSRREKRELNAALTELSPSRDERRELLHRAFVIARKVTEGAEAKHAMGWLEEVVALLELEAERQSWGVAEVWFSPGPDCVARLVSLFDVAKDTVDICVFTITHDRITRAMERAHERKVRIRVISDDEKSRDPGSDIRRLARAGIPVELDHVPAHMHHKFAIFDGRLLANGSYNWTRSAAEENNENLVVSGDIRLVSAFREEFERLWSTFYRKKE